MVEVRLKLVVQVCLVEGISSRFRSGFWLWEKWSFLAGFFPDGLEFFFGFFFCSALPLPSPFVRVGCLDFVEDCGFLSRALLVEEAVELEMD